MSPGSLKPASGKGGRRPMAPHRHPRSGRYRERVLGGATTSGSSVPLNTKDQVNDLISTTTIPRIGFDIESCIRLQVGV